MKNRLAKTLLATAAVAAFAAPVAAQAKHGADDPAGHVRHAVHQTTASKASTHQQRERERHGRRHARRADDRRHGRGTDDRLAGQRQGRGTDDGPNHT
jgi:Ni/Co efflux regulator RcnB